MSKSISLDFALAYIMRNHVRGDKKLEPKFGRLGACLANIKRTLRLTNTEEEGIICMKLFQQISNAYPNIISHERFEKMKENVEPGLLH